MNGNHLNFSKVFKQIKASNNHSNNTNDNHTHIYRRNIITSTKLIDKLNLTKRIKMKLENETILSGTNNGCGLDNATGDNTKQSVRPTQSCETSSKESGTLNVDPSSGVIKSLFASRSPPEYANNLAKIIVHACQTYAQKTLIVDCPSGRRWTGAQILDKVARITAGLLNNGLERGDAAFLVCEHDDRETLMALSVILLGGVLCASGPGDGYNEHRVISEYARPKLIVGARAQHRMMRQLKADQSARADAIIVWIDADNDECVTTADSNNNNDGNHQDDTLYDIVTYKQLLAHKALTQEQIKQLCNSIDAQHHTACLMLTSGSTGKQKVVVTKHASLVQSLVDIKEPKLWCLGPSQVMSGDIPLDHMTGLSNLLLSMLYGSTIALMPPYQEQLFAEYVERYKITDAMLSVAFAYKIMAHILSAPQKLNRSYNIDSLRNVICVGARIHESDLVKQFLHAYPHVIIRQGYGATETTFMTIMSVDDHRGRLSCSGYLVPGIEAKIVDACTGQPLTRPYQRGELCVRGKTLFGHYLDMPEATRNAFDSEHFYKTGDLVYMDSNNRLYIENRIKDTLFLDEEWKIPPAELESVVCQHPAVDQCAVVGLAHSTIPNHHVPRAFVQLKPGYLGVSSSATYNGETLSHQAGQQQVSLVSEQEICDFVAARVAKAKRLTAGVRFLDRFPTTGPLSKIDRKLLKQLP